MKWLVIFMMNDFFEKILKKVKVGVIILNEQLEILFWNKNLEKLTQRSSSEVEGKKLSNVFEIFRKNVYQNFFQDVLISGQSIFCSGALHDVFIQPAADKKIKQNMLLAPLEHDHKKYIILL